MDDCTAKEEKQSNNERGKAVQADHDYEILESYNQTLIYDEV